MFCMVTELSADTFKQKINDLSLVDFYAEWCGPCKQLAPVLEQLEKELPKIKFYKLNVDHAQDIAAQFGVMSIPCLILFNHGKEIDRIVGFYPKERLKQELEKFI